MNQLYNLGFLNPQQIAHCEKVTPSLWPSIWTDCVQLSARSFKLCVTEVVTAHHWGLYQPVNMIHTLKCFLADE